MRITNIMGRLRDAGDAGSVGRVVGELGREEIGVIECGVTWHVGPVAVASGPAPWWDRMPVQLERMLVHMREHHGPVTADGHGDGIHKLLVPIIEPTGLLGAVCCGHPRPYDAEQRRDLCALAMHASVRLAQLGARATSTLVLSQLTRRQADVAQLAASGRTNAAIAATLGLSANTVKKHLKDIFDTLGVANRTELAVRLQSAGTSDRDAPGHAHAG